jgi:predicted TIM-barrel fold metal-dependent hydrolase
MKPTFIDCHCHLFDKDMLSSKLLLRIILAIPNIFEKEKDDKKLMKKVRNQQGQFERVLNFLKMGLNHNEEEIFLQMQQVYGNDFAITPLMFDLENCFNEKNDTNIYQSIIEKTEELILSIRNHVNNTKQIKDYQTQTTKLSELANLLSKQVKDIKANNNEKITEDGFEEEISSLIALKKKYPYKVYPFFVIDPRRKGIVKRFITEIYPQNIFSGIKLYTPNGYSPTDPELMNDNGLYAFCEKNQIPITAHHSFGGFASPLTEIEIRGDIFQNNQVVPVSGIVQFTKMFTDDWVQDRATKLNHPLLWKKVLDKYPLLKLDLAHFGNGNKEWQDILFSLMQQYDNLYSDLACYTDANDLLNVKQNYFEKATDKVKKKFLYGSDFYLNLLFIDSLGIYFQQFKDTMKDDYLPMAQTNAYDFLGIK